MVNKKKRRAETPVYHVEVFTKARVSADGTWEYFVKWAGYDSDADSWEPAENVSGCHRLLQSFWTHIGTDNDDYPPGYLVEASAEWIIDERRYFAIEYSQQQKEARKQRELEEAQKKKGRSEKHRLKSQGSSNGSKKHGKGKGKAKLLVSDDDDSDEKLLATTIRIPPPKKRKLTSDEGGSSYSDPYKTLKTILSPSTLSPAPTTQKGKGKEKAKSLHQEQPPSPTSLFSAPSSPEPPTADIPPPVSLAESGPSKPGASSKALSHHDKQTNRRVKLLPTKTATSGSTLSTKQRITQAALFGDDPKLIIPTIPPKKFANLNFKKKSLEPGPSNVVPQAPEPAFSHEEPPPSPGVPNTQPGSPLFSDLFTDGPDLVQSPAGVSDTVQLMDYESDPFASFMPTSEPTGASPVNDDHFPHQSISPVIRAKTVPSAQSSIDSTGEADAFLQSIMPPELAAPLTPTTIEPPPPPRTLPPIKLATLPRIPKKWKWAGDLFLDIDQDRAERLCDVTLTDTTDFLPEGLRLHILFSSLDSIRFQKLYDIVDLDRILPAFKPSEQVARLGPQNDHDIAPLTSLARHLELKQQFTFAPLTLDGALIAVLLVFPFASEHLRRRFKVPKNMEQSGSLVATVIPWAISTEQRKKEWRKACDDKLPSSDTTMVIDSARRDRLLRSNPTFCRALHALEFPKWLYDHMPNRRFCIWHSGGDGTAADMYSETVWLQSILSQCQATNGGLKADVRVVFVHVGALKTLHYLPGLAERRSKRAELQFFTYGTHETISPDRWGVHEIFPLGGIATFTPSVIIEDPIGVCKMITDFAKHPLWECYILPPVMGMVSKLTCGDQDPLSVFDKGDFIYDNILALIEQGEISLIQAPPLDRCSSQGEEPSLRWVGKQCRLMLGQTRGLLDECMKGFNELFLNVQECDWSSSIEKEILKDLLCMQMQPVIMENFRRFVVIKGTTDDHINWNKEGLEWYTLDQFKFKDD